MLQQKSGPNLPRSSMNIGGIGLGRHRAWAAFILAHGELPVLRQEINGKLLKMGRMSHCGQQARACLKCDQRFMG